MQEEKDKIPKKQAAINVYICGL